MATIFCAAVVLVGLSFIVAPVTISGLVLSAAGFGQLGVAAGTPAAIIQGWLGNVAAGSAFAVAQSASASVGGVGMAAIAAGMQAVGAVVITIMAAFLALVTKFTL